MTDFLDIYKLRAEHQKIENLLKELSETHSVNSADTSMTNLVVSMLSILKDIKSELVTLNKRVSELENKQFVVSESVQKKEEKKQESSDTVHFIPEIDINAESRFEVQKEEIIDL